MADLSAIAQDESVQARFWAKVDRRGTDECWLWLGATDGRYGGFYCAGRLQKSHRVALAMAGAILGEGQVVCHRCDVTLCVNPAHLFVGSQADNLRDMTAKLRRSGGVSVGSRNGFAKLTEKDAADILASELGTVALSRLYGVNRCTVGRIRSGITWRHAAGLAKEVNDEY